MVAAVSRNQWFWVEVEVCGPMGLVLQLTRFGFCWTSHLLLAECNYMEKGFFDAFFALLSRL